MSTILKIDFQKKKQLDFSEEKVSKLHTQKKNIILHVTITFSIKQGETRTNSGSITLP